MKRLPFAAAVGLVGMALVSSPPQAAALVYCETNVVDVHQSAPTGTWSESGWQMTAPVGQFLATVIRPNAALTAKHLAFSAGRQFVYEGLTHTRYRRGERRGQRSLGAFLHPRRDERRPHQH
jgi:hypothetical protein